MALRDAEPALQSAATSPSFQSLSVAVLEPMSVGEVQRHFDTDTTTSIHGWMEHRFWLEGWGLGVGLGRVGVGVGRLSIPGLSTVALEAEGTSRANLMADGFVAVLESHDGPRVNVVRVVCPSEPGVRELVQGLLSSVSSQFGEGSHTQPIAGRLSKSLSVTTDVSHVSDRLHAILRLPSSERPTVRVAGAPITEHAFFGSAVQFDGDERWYRLAPIAVLDEIANVTSVAIAEAPTWSARSPRTHFGAAIVVTLIITALLVGQDLVCNPMYLGWSSCP